MVRNRITIKRWSYTQDEAGGISRVLALEYPKFADVERRSGSVGVEQGKREWSYDYRIRVRFTKDFIERSGDTIEHDGYELAINEPPVFEREGEKRFVILRCSTVEQIILTEDETTFILVDNGGNEIVTDQDQNIQINTISS